MEVTGYLRNRGLFKEFCKVNVTIRTGWVEQRQISPKSYDLYTEAASFYRRIKQPINYVIAHNLNYIRLKFLSLITKYTSIHIERV